MWFMQYYVFVCAVGFEFCLLYMIWFDVTSSFAQQRYCCYYNYYCCYYFIEVYNILHVEFRDLKVYSQSGVFTVPCVCCIKSVTTIKFIGGVFALRVYVMLCVYNMFNVCVLIELNGLYNLSRVLTRLVLCYIFIYGCWIWMDWKHLHDIVFLLSWIALLARSKMHFSAFFSVFIK